MHKNYAESWNELMIQGYSQRMRLQRRLYGICSSPFSWIQSSLSGQNWHICVLNHFVNHSFIHSFIHSYFCSPTKHEILQISNHNLICSLDPPNQNWLFWVVGPNLKNNLMHKKIKLQIIIFLEFLVVLTNSSFVGIPVYKWINLFR